MSEQVRTNGRNVGLLLAGRPEEARPHYRAIVDRWGAAKPRSITADSARAGLRKLDRGQPP